MIFSEIGIHTRLKNIFKNFVPVSKMTIYSNAHDDCTAAVSQRSSLGYYLLFAQ